MPFRYSQGSAASIVFARRTYGGTSDERNTTGSPVRERTFGTFTDTGPTPVTTSRSGKYPFRTTAARPSSSVSPS